VKLGGQENMKKKILLSLAVAAVVVGGIAAFSAYEAHVINVTAHIENALTVNTTPIEFGTVFPQEYLERTFTVSLSDSFLGADRVDDVEYVIKQKPKCKLDPIYSGGDLPLYAAVNYWDHLCPVNYLKMEDLCKFLSKTPVDSDGDTPYPSYYSNPNNIIGDYDDECRSFDVSIADATGYLMKSLGDVSDTWIIDLKVPPVDGTIGQDWPLSCADWTVPANDVDYGCDLWVEVTGISETLTNSVCQPELVFPCSTGLLGICEIGTKVCDQSGSWGECVGSQPSAEVCDDGLDNDCDGYTYFKRAKSL